MAEAATAARRGGVRSVGAWRSPRWRRVAEESAAAARRGGGHEQLGFLLYDHIILLLMHWIVFLIRFLQICKDAVSCNGNEPIHSCPRSSLHRFEQATGEALALRVGQRNR